MKRILSLIAAMALLLGLSSVAAAEGSTDPATIDASIFTVPENLFEAGYDGIECMDIDLGIYHLIPARTSGIGDYFYWTGKLEKMPELTEDNGGCFTSATNAPKTVIFWDGVPNLSKNLFKWAEGKTRDVYIPDSVTEIDEECFEFYSRITLHFTENNKVALDYARNHCMMYEVIGKGWAGDKTLMDATVFEMPEGAPLNYLCCECMDGFFLNLGHYWAYGIHYFRWGGGDEKMSPENIEETCFGGGTTGLKTIVFWNGVPNLCQDLFTRSEGEVQDVYVPDSVTEIDEDCFLMDSTITLHFTENNEVALAYAQSHHMRYEIMGKGYYGKVKLDDTVFEVPADLSDGYDVCECMDPLLLKLNHYERQGVNFFHWIGEDGKLSSDGVEETCFGGGLAHIPTIVFWNGVPNLPKDLFKGLEGIAHDVYIPDTVTEIDEDCFVMDSTIRLHFTHNNAVALAYAKARGMRYEIMGRGWGGPVAFDTSVFDMPVDLEERACTDRRSTGLSHYEKFGVSFFKNNGSAVIHGVGESQMVCFTNPPEDAAMETIVFLRGMPNLSSQLLYWLEGITHDVYVPDSVKQIAEDCFVMNSTITIHFTQNNAVALAYAQNRGMAFEVMDGERVPGDVDYDKSVDMKDVLALRKSIAKLPAAYEIGSLDVNGDGEANMKDVLALRRKIAHLDVISHADYAAAELGASVTVETYVQDKQIWVDGKASFYAQSEDGAYFIYAMPCTQEEYDALTPGTKIRVSGTKSAWKDEVEITDATFEIIDGSFIAEPVDVTALLGTDKLVDHQNEKVVFKGLTVEAKTDPEGKKVAFLYNWNGVGGEGDDLYFDATVDGKKVTFTVESDLCGAETDVYKAVKALKIGDTIDLTCYLYWYDGPNPHVFAVTPAT